MKTGKPELSDGYLRIANELHEAISRAKFTQYERSLIDLILRLSYGCKQSLVADVLHWSDLKVVGIPRQHARSTAEALKDNKVIKITYPSGRIRFRLNKYYLQWKVQFGNNDKLYAKLVTLNTDDHKPLEDFGNTSVTDQENGNTSVTFEAGCNTGVTEKVTPVLHESNTSVTEAGAKPAETQVSSEPKESKERNQTNKASSFLLPELPPEIAEQSIIDDSGWVPVEDTAEDWVDYLIDIMKKPEQRYAPIAVQELAQWLVSNNDLELLSQCFDEFAKVPLKKVFNRTGFFLKLVSDVGGNVNFRQ